MKNAFKILVGFILFSNSIHCQVNQGDDSIVRSTEIVYDSTDYYKWLLKADSTILNALTDSITLGSLNKAKDCQVVVTDSVFIFITMKHNKKHGPFLKITNNGQVTFGSYSKNKKSGRWVNYPSDKEYFILEFWDKGVLQRRQVVSGGVSK